MSQLNRLYCSGCNCPRSIFQFPLKDGWRTAMCASCLERQALRYIGIQERREREREQGEQDIGKSTDLFTGRLTLSGLQTRCLSCLQVRELGRFLTCEPCHSRNRKTKRRQTPVTRPPPPTQAKLADHIQRRQQATGKLERGWAGYQAIIVDDYTRQPSQEDEQELQDRQQQREEGRVTRRVWEEERKERARELYIKRGELEGGFEIWWEER